MFFLIRMAFWVGLILLILPIGVSSDGGRQIGAWQALTAIQSVIADARGFCQRQPDACAVGGDVIAHLGDKAQAGVKWLYEAIGSEPHPPAPAGPAPSAAVHSAMPEPAESQAIPYTLTPQDLLPAWGGEMDETPLSQPASVPLPPRRPA